MKWSWRIGRIAGIDVYLHLTFLLLVGWIGLSYYLPGRNLVAGLAGVASILVLFGIIVLHELGHALTARRYGIPTRDITLLPIGGVARLEKMPDDPRQELWVALAGPAVNVVLALVCAALLLGFTQTPLKGPVDLVAGHPLRNLVWINVVLAVFNMIPAFPMDGGRVLRALLALRLDYVRATRIAASVGQMLALGFGFIGLFSNPFLVIIALFVWMGAAAEANMVQMKSSLGGVQVREAMITEFRTVSASDSLRTVADHVLAGFQQDFPVHDGTQLVGILTRKDLLAAIARDGVDGTVARAMRSEFEVVGVSDLLEPAYARLQSTESHALPVLQDGRLVGILTLENLSEYLMLQAATRTQ